MSACSPEHHQVDFSGIRKRRRGRRAAQIDVLGGLLVAGGADDGQALCAATPPGQDAWIQANQSSLATMVRQFAGELTPLQAVQAGVFPACRAWPIDQLLIAAWQE